MDKAALIIVLSTFYVAAFTGELLTKEKKNRSMYFRLYENLLSDYWSKIITEFNKFKKHFLVQSSNILDPILQSAELFSYASTVLSEIR